MSRIKGWVVMDEDKFSKQWGHPKTRNIILVEARKNIRYSGKHIENMYQYNVFAEGYDIFFEKTNSKKRVRLGKTKTKKEAENYAIAYMRRNP